MPDATLIIIPPSQVAREIEISSDNITSIGRALDNTICIEGDSNVSRYHAEIEARGNDFWVYDLDSANGTTVNDEPVGEGRVLAGGDLISVGGETVIEFHLGRKQILRENKKEEETSSSSSPFLGGGGGSLPLTTSTTTTTASANAPVAGGGVSPLLIVAGVMGGLAVAAVLGVGIWFAFFKSPCPGDVRITFPESGTTINGPVQVRLKLNEGDEKCIDRVIYQIDGEDKIEMEAAPYEATLDPITMGLDDGFSHKLSLVVVPLKGNQRISQAQTIQIAYSVTKPPDGGQNGQVGPSPGSTGTPPPLPPGVNPEAMSKQLASMVGKRDDYVFNQQFLNMINGRVPEYRSVGGAASKARRFKFEINRAFTDEGLDPLIGYVLAMSRSKFDERTSGPQGAGLWQMPPEIAKGYLKQGETEAVLNDPKRSAEIAAAYLKALMFNAFELGQADFMYAIACFGMTLEQATTVRVELRKATSANQMLRRDFMQMTSAGVIKPEMQERVVRFFAAGMVCENPQAFGINDQPCSSLR
jgi:hypothetical protein